MKIKKRLYKYRILIILLIVSFVSMGFLGDDKKSTKIKKETIYKVTNTTEDGGKKGDAYRLNINNINLPMNRAGIIADVNIPDPNPIIDGSGGKFAGQVFLFSSGHFLSGYSNGTLFSNGNASASLIEDYVPGVAGSTGDPRAQLYVLKAADPAFGTAWQDWKDAVELGADFYDGDGDGIYNPVDKNGNGLWDVDEDKPDLLGDETVWTVYWDGKPAPQRRYINVNPLGIEVRQTVFAFASSGAIGNLIFVRYKFKYVGLGNASEADQLEDVYFGVWADVDLGDANDDRVGSDTIRNAGYTFNNGPDDLYGTQPPCYMIDFFSGPLDYIPGETFTDNNGNGIWDDGIDTPLDTAHSYRGQTIGVIEYPGAKNLPIASFIAYMNGQAGISDPSNREEARNYMLGRQQSGADTDPCTFAWGQVQPGTNCNEVNPAFWYSGDPVTNTGWINTQEADSRQMTNTGPFTLRKNEEKEIVVAYVVGQGADDLNAITIARSIDDGAQIIFNNNFLAPSAPPAPVVTTSSNEAFIDLAWQTEEQLPYRSLADAWDVKFGGYNVYALKTFNTSSTINNQENVKLIARYQVDDFINNLYAESGETGGIELLYEAAPDGNRLDSNVYKDPSTGRIRLRITNDPFTGGNLVKGKHYYFIVTSYGVNHDALINKDGGNFGDFGDYYLTSLTFVQTVENPITLGQVKTILHGEDIYTPPLPIVDGSKISGGSSGRMQYDVVSKDALTGDKYKVTFFIDSASTNYETFWRLENTTTSTILRDSVSLYTYGSTDITRFVTEGFISRVSDETPNLADALEVNTAQNWATANYFYLGKDMGADNKQLSGGGNAVTSLQSNYVKADKLRKVVLKFDQPGKAYRYLNGFVGANPPARRSSYTYAGGVVAGHPGITDPTILNEIGQLGVGYVDVPFTAWVEDENFGETRQLAVGFIERKISEGGIPDGVWDPGTNVNQTGEFIFVFDASYDPNGNQMEYTGNFPAGSVVWADIKGYTIPADANATVEQRKKASSPFFDVLYAFGLSKIADGTFYSSGDEFIVNVEQYPYTSADVFEFQTKKEGVLTAEEQKALFDKINVFPNPLYGYNPATSNYGLAADDPFVTFTNLPNEEITIKIYSLAGQLLNTLVKSSTSTSPFLNWNLQNESGLRVASGLYIAIVSSPQYGEKLLKFSIIMPQKQLPRF